MPGTLLIECRYQRTRSGAGNSSGAGYFIAAPQGGSPGDITVYDVAAKVDGVAIDEDVVGVLEASMGSFGSSNATPFTTPACRLPHPMEPALL